MYSLLIGVFPNVAYCLIKNEDGWEVYYSERGEKSDIQQFASESEACEYLLKNYHMLVRMTENPRNMRRISAAMIGTA